MKTCPVCGGQVRVDAVFCPSCGTSFDPKKKRESAPEPPVATVPLITLAPQANTFSKQRLIRYGKLVIGIVIVTAIALATAAGAAWIKTKPFKTSSIESVDTDIYRKCIALVSDVRNDNFDAIVEDLVYMEGAAEDYNFLSEYEKLFKEIIPDEPADENTDPEQYKTAVKFRNCCFMVAFTEFQAKRYNNLAEKALLGSFYREKADTFRNYADELWEKLNNSQSDEQLQEIIDFCADREIITLKQPQK